MRYFSNDIIILTFPNISRPLPFFINALYFWWSLAFLVAKTTVTLLIASKINEESQKPIKLLRTIPTEGWFDSTQRFAYQLQNQCVALSGKKYFLITRGIIMSIAGTVVTYELVDHSKEVLKLILIFASLPKSGFNSVRRPKNRFRDVQPLRQLDTRRILIEKASLLFQQVQSSTIREIIETFQNSIPTTEEM